MDAHHAPVRVRMPFSAPPKSTNAPEVAGASIVHRELGILDSN
ncbi:MAG: hypothetical protein RLZZ558_768 [Planctomycetota bacterium]|jgi:hypothetical protein